MNSGTIHFTTRWNRRQAGGDDMKGKNKRKPTIFRIFLIPLITIMLAQGMITIGTLVVRRTGATLEE